MLARRRTLNAMLVAITLSVGLAGHRVIAAQGPMPPTELRTEYLRNPMGLDTPHPRFFWVLNHSSRGEAQTAYQLLVATRPELLRQDQGDQWDSGRVNSDESTQVVYGGKPLVSGRTYYWKVRYWDKEDRPTPYSAPATFEMGILSRGEWKARWIHGQNLFRKEVQLEGAVSRARAYVSGLGYYELRINGQRVGENVLDPAWTIYDKRVLYSAYDVTHELKRGANAIGVMLGGGWARHGGTPGHFQPGYRGMALLLELRIELEDGRQVTVASDSSWKTTQGPVLEDSVYDGEVYDARREMPGWDEPGFDDSAWPSAEQGEGPAGVLSAEMMPPIRVVDTLVPVKLMNPKPGVYVYDLGQNISGWAQLRVRGPRGASVKMRFAELVYPDGMINRENIRAAKARDVYTLRGEGLEVYEPHFTYHGFRYVEVTGFPGTPSLDSIRGRVVHTAVQTIGSFVASNPVLNAVQKLIRWSQQTNLMSIPTDCDQRDERQGWMGDAQVTAEEAMMNFDMAAFYTNFIRDIHDNQGPDGTVTDTVPHRYGSRPADPAWGTAYPLLCWYMWQQYGDRRILEANYEGLQKYVAFLRSRAQDNVLTYSYYGDWVSIVPTPGALVSDAYYFFDTQILRKVAQVLGRTEDAQTYTQLEGQIKEAFNHRFFDPITGHYGTQAADAMALYLDLVPEDHRGSVAGWLQNDITYTHNTHVTTGFIGIKFLMPALTAIGRTDLAYELAKQTTYPSWGYMEEHGATTLWELWQEKTGPSMNSHNHAMFGSVGDWFYKALAGISLDGDSVGYRRLLIRPGIVEDLTWASASLESLRGMIAVSWNHAPSTVTLEVTVPVGSEARVVIPKDEEMTEVTIREGGRTIWEHGHFVPGDPGVTAGTHQHNDYAFTVGSGHYIFTLTGE